MFLKTKVQTHDNYENIAGNRKKIAFFDYPDVFEDFYPHYGVDQNIFATIWHNTGNHAWLKIIQEEIGNITWYVLTLNPEQKSNQAYPYGVLLTRAMI